MVKAENIHDAPDGQYLGYWQSNLLSFDDKADKTITYVFYTDKAVNTPQPLECDVQVKGKNITIIPKHFKIR